MPSDEMHTIAENSLLHISTSLTEDEAISVRNYDVVIVNDASSSPIGAFILKLWRGSGIPRERWHCGFDIILRDKYEPDHLVEKYPNINTVLSGADFFDAKEESIKDASPAKHFALKQLARASGEVFDIDDGVDTGLADAQKDMHWWQKHGMMGNRSLKTAESVLLEVRKLSGSADPVLSEKQLQILLRLSEKEPPEQRSNKVM